MCAAVNAFASGKNIHFVEVTRDVIELVWCSSSTVSFAEHSGTMSCFSMDRAILSHICFERCGKLLHLASNFEDLARAVVCRLVVLEEILGAVNIRLNRVRS